MVTIGDAVIIAVRVIRDTVVVGTVVGSILNVSSGVVGNSAVGTMLDIGHGVIGNTVVGTILDVGRRVVGDTGSILDVGRGVVGNTVVGTILNVGHGVASNVGSVRGVGDGDAACRVHDIDGHDVWRTRIDTGRSLDGHGRACRGIRGRRCGGRRCDAGTCNGADGHRRNQDGAGNQCREPPLVIDSYFSHGYLLVEACAVRGNCSCENIIRHVEITVR